ncbi:MAG: metallophosphoesterase [Verrucomicrobia bacterium]|nr:metallophosphoesterase [Verrucomicrobiota bacterium]
MSICGRIVVLSLCLAAPARALDNLPEAANWIANSSFEVGSGDCPVDWKFFNQHEVITGTWDGSSAHSGAQGVAVHGDGGLAYGRWLTPYRIPFEPGERCRVSFWYRGAGAQVYLQGRASSLNVSGIYSNNLTKYYKTMLGPTPATSDWTYVETEFAAPDYPSWAQLCLGGSGRDTCEFDDIMLARTGLVLIDPTSPLLTAPGATNHFTFYAEELRDHATNTVIWQVESDHFALQSVSLDATQKLWTLEVIATNTGVADIIFLAATNGSPSVSLSLPRAARVHAGTGGAFAFTVMTDLHFYRPGSNERNDKFGKLADSLNALDPLFAISLGDQLEIHSGYRDEEKKYEVAAVQEQLARVEVPLFKVAGNHEVDKSYEGSGTQWYFEKLMQVTPYFSLEVDGTLIAGVDDSAPGNCAREHGGAFLRDGQAAWVSDLLGSYTGRMPILCAHISPYTEFANSADRDQLMTIIFTNRVRAFLAGHLHYTKDEWVRNPVADGGLGPPWPTPTLLTNSAAGTLKLADASNTVFLTTTTGSAFLLGGSPFNGYRYLLVRDQAIVWQDVLPISLSVTRTTPADNIVTYYLTNGVDKAITGLPLRADLPDGTVTATLDAAPLAVDVTTNSMARLIVWVQPDIPTGTTATVSIRSD